MRRAALILVLLAVAACREGTPPDAGALPPLPDYLAEATRECTRAGGRMVEGSVPGLRFCQRQTSDGGKQCRRAQDCDGDCLARSGTCAPVTPLMGCHEILMANGVQAMLCRD